MSDMTFNLFNDVNYELSHSAVWAWVLRCADDSAADVHPGPHKLARRFFERVGVRRTSGQIVVRREVVLPGLRDRLDIEVADAKGQFLAVETKVSAIPSAEQALRYLSALGPGAQLVILSSAFDLDVRADLPKRCRYIGLAEMQELLKPNADSHPVLSDYSAWLAHRRSERARLARQALSAEEGVRAEALATPEGQWSLMSAIGQAVGSSGSQYRAKNLGGTPWTQLCFCDGDEKAHDAIFYRIDRSARGDYFSVRQYESEPFPSVSAKLARLEKLRAWWADACARSKSLVPRQARSRGKKESEIGWFLLSENVPTVLLGELPRVHKAFIARLRDAGWPVVS